MSTTGRAGTHAEPHAKTADETLAGHTEAAERRRLEREILLVGDREQRRISVALHDGLGTHLTGVSLLVRGLARDLRRGRSVDAGKMDDIAWLLADAIRQTRTLAQGLNPFLLAIRGLTIAFSELASTVESASGISCTFEEDENGDGDLALSGEQSMHLYRIAEEAVANSVRHAQASRIRITLSRRDGRCRVAVGDDGIGIQTGEPTDAKPAGMGLSIMRYRAELIGARLDVTGSPGRGTTVTCTFRAPA